MYLQLSSTCMRIKQSISENIRVVSDKNILMDFNLKKFNPSLFYAGHK